MTRRLTNTERESFKLNDFLKQVLIGNILGVAKMRKFNINIGGRGKARVRFL